MKHEDLVQGLENAIARNSDYGYFSAKAKLLDSFLADRDYEGLVEVADRVGSSTLVGISSLEGITVRGILSRLSNEAGLCELAIERCEKYEKYPLALGHKGLLEYVRVMVEYAPHLRAALDEIRGEK